MKSKKREGVENRLSLPSLITEAKPAYKMGRWAKTFPVCHTGGLLKSRTNLWYVPQRCLPQEMGFERAEAGMTLDRFAASIAIGLAGFSLFGVAMVMMKYGAGVLADPRTMFTGRENRKKSAVWILGCGANVAYVVLFSIALGMGHASVVSALNGFGLVVAALLSSLFLRERISRSEALGMCAVVLGTGAVGYWGRQSIEEFVFSPSVFWGFALATFFVNLAAAGWTLLRGYRGADIVFAANAGYLGGISALLQKIFMTPLMETWGEGAGAGRLAALLSEPYAYAFLVTSMASFAMIQVAYQFGKAVRVVPTFSSAIILTPVAGAAVVFHEEIRGGQWVGIALILAGIFLLSAQKQRPG